MDWLKALLKAAGLDDAAIEKIIGDAGKELPKHFVPKDKYNELSEAKKQADKDVIDRDNQIAELGKTAGLSEELKAQITTLTAENQAAAERHATEMKDLQLSNAIKAALTGKVHDEGLAAGLIAKDKLVLDGDKIVGLDEQIAALQKDKAFLFKDDTQQQQQQQKPGFHVGGGGNPTPPSGEVSLKDAIAAHFQAN